ncbi:lipoprotein insertase outer membrane protein LolB [Bordetella sputigena]|uniref:lipoprotein insertase outer membrane protein LolB n=1 Tax=Bordetella sputigena TaxID=1416810 RepID=UPI0039EF9E33
MLSRWRAVMMAALCLILTACVTPGRIAGSGGAGEFSRVGRFALTVTQDDGKQDALQGGFSWLDDGRRYVLDLTNPLGATQARVEGQPGMAVLTKSDGTRLRATDPDELVADALGSSIPVSGLRDWLRGRLPQQPPAAQVRRDDSQRPLSFDQGGWQARLSRYDDLGPQVLVLERREPDRRILLRLVVNPS